ncbi:MAG: geranylgeranylglycerol-phosphate geranylgeranyltransferase [Bacteroidales bacterium]|nr:geranylgeranylglycerol-phosphate geranylgeranyltransferase [Bacteroidales bacterium]
MNAFFKIIRIKNLLMILLLQVLINWCLVHPILTLYELEPTFTVLDFVFLTAATVMLAAGGYIINDYFDTKSDMINRPDNVVIGNDVSRGNALAWHLGLNIAACVLGAVVSLRIGVWLFALFFPFVSGLLWFYSSTYKKMFLLGNVIVAFLTSMVPLLPVAYEIPGQIAVGNENVVNGLLDLNILFYWALGFALFAFVTTLFREIIKDIEDVDGDREIGRNTVPAVIGVTASKIVSSVLIVATIAALVVVWHTFLGDTLSAVYFGVALVLPLLFLIYKVMTMNSKKEIHFVSTLAKIIMLAGILYLFVVRYNIIAVAEE